MEHDPEIILAYRKLVISMGVKQTVYHIDIFFAASLFTTDEAVIICKL